MFLVVSFVVVSFIISNVIDLFIFLSGKLYHDLMKSVCSDIHKKAEFSYHLGVNAFIFNKVLE